MERELRLSGSGPRLLLIGQEIRVELVRKTIHLLVGLVPLFASFNLNLTYFMLAAGTLVYASSETLRMGGVEVPIISRVTALAARQRDSGHFVLGPVTLGIGAMLSLLLYPEPAASIAIYSLAFGDGLSSLVGKLFGSIRLPFTGGKSLEGSLTCFFAVFIAAYSLTQRAPESLGIALVAMLVEAAPLKDFDNIVLPMAAGLASLLLL
ncbi:MAG: phosphatidate cytidylyltransferase [Spirochaetota bacterium]